MNVVEVFADVRCPFTHVGLRRLVERRTELHRDVPRLRVRAWPLELVNGEPLSPELVGREVVALRDQVAPDLFGRPMTEPFPPTSLPGLALAGAAYRVSDQTGEAVSLALRDAMFEAGLDVASPGVLAEIAEKHGVPAVTDADHQQVVHDWEEGRQRGVVGSPHFFVGGAGYFCPSLDIRHEGGEFAVRYDEAAMASFLASVFAG